MQCRMDHIVINVVDMEKMLVFYTEILQLKPERLEEYRAGTVPFPSVRLSTDTIIDLFPQHMWQKSPAAAHCQHNLNHFCIALDRPQWNRLQERLKSNNVAIEEGPVPRWGAYGTGTSIYFRDPENTLIEARYYAEPSGLEKCLLGS